jgi:hypothetical protein
MAITNVSYTKMGDFTVVPLADLSLLAASCNLNGDARKGTKGGSTALGKTAGMVLLADHGAGQFSMVVALGSAPNAKWQNVAVPATQYTPI